VDMNVRPFQEPALDTTSRALRMARPRAMAAPADAADREFEAMMHAFAPHGSMTSGDELLRTVRLAGDVPISALARPIAMRHVVSITYRGALLLPNFQFEPGTLRVLGSVDNVLRVLRTLHDDWYTALWFALPLASLGGIRPVDALERHASDVHAAARDAWFGNR
jgi:hypothetical protein